MRGEVHSIAERSDEAKVRRRQKSKVLAEGDILAQEHDRLVGQVTEPGVDARHHVCDLTLDLVLF